MKVTPAPYYICNYCEKTSDRPNFKYEDNSGLDNITFDMCSDECRDKHIDYLKRRIPKEEFDEYIEEWLTENTTKKLGK